MTLPRSEVWPHEVAAMKEGQITFKPVITTIQRVFPAGEKGGWACTFREDTNRGPNDRSPIWSMYQPSGETAEPIDPVREGDQVVARLSAKARDNGGYFWNLSSVVFLNVDSVKGLYDPETHEERYTGAGRLTGVPKSTATPQQPSTATGETPPPVSGDQRDPTRASIERQVAVKGWIDLLNGDAYERLSTDQAKWVGDMAMDGLYTLWEGQPPPKPEPEDHAAADAEADGNVEAASW